MTSARRALLAAIGLAVLTPAPLMAQTPPMPTPQHDYKAAPAGKYVIDARHTGLVARVPHLGFSYSVFRFRTVSGTLHWDPLNSAADTLSVTVDPKSIATAPVAGFSEELTGGQFLDVVKFPTATFVSHIFRPTDATHGVVEGDLTIMGVTKPVTFDVELVGDGPGVRGPVIGVTARAHIDPKNYALPPFIPADIELVIDTEFDKAP